MKLQQINSSTNPHLLQNNTLTLDQLILDYNGKYDHSYLINHPAVNSLSNVSISDPDSCCETTIVNHAEHNKLIVCDNCHKWIKIFDDFDVFKNFVIFSNSRNRKVGICRVENYFLAIYHSRN